MQVLDEQFLKNGFKAQATARKTFSLEDTEEGSIQCEILNKNDDLKWKVAFQCPDGPGGTKVRMPNMVILITMRVHRYLGVRPSFRNCLKGRRQNE